MSAKVELNNVCTKYDKIVLQNQRLLKYKMKRNKAEEKLHDSTKEDTNLNNLVTRGKRLFAFFICT